MKLHHIGKVVEDLNKAKKYYLDYFGLKATGPAVVDPLQKVKVVFLVSHESSGFSIELIQPIDDSSPVSSFLEKGGGLHHLCFEVENIHEAIEELKKKRCLILSEAVLGKGHQDCLTAWIFTEDRELVELVEKKSD